MRTRLEESEEENDSDFEDDDSCDDEGVGSADNDDQEVPLAEVKDKAVTKDIGQMLQLVIPGKRTVYVPERFSPAPSFIEDDDDSDDQDISLDSSTRNISPDDSDNDVMLVPDGEVDQ